MKFLTLEIQNFGRIEEATLSLDSRGLVLIQGDNQDDTSANSNGAGKSTVVEAISWCLYGRTAKKKKPADSIVNRKNKKNCRVALRLRDEDGTEFLIERHRKHKTHKNEVILTQINTDETETALSKGTDAATQPEIDKVMGCGYDVFTAAIYAGQEKMPDLPMMTDKQLKMLIEESAGLNTLDKAYELARSELSQANSELTSHKVFVETAENTVERDKEMLASVEEAVKIWNSERDVRLVDLSTELRTVAKSLASLKKRLEGLSTLEQLAEERDALKSSFDKIGAENKKLDELKAAERDAERQVDRRVTAIENKSNECRRLLADYKLVKGSIGEPCTSCGRPHDEDSLKSAIDAAFKKLKAEKMVLDDLRGGLEELQESFKNAQQARKNFERTKSDATDLVELSEQISQREAATKEVLSEIERVKKEARRLKDASDREKAAENPHVERKAKAKDRLDKSVANLREVKAETAEFERAVSVKTEVARVFSPKGIRAHILDTVTPFLNKQTAHYMATLSDGRFEAVWSTLKVNKDGTLSENFSITAKDIIDGGTFEDMSGGERRKVRVATALALQDLVATRASKSLDLWVGDEIDAALDASGLERLMSLLNDKASERDTVLVISHSDLRDWFSRSITVVREGDVSRIE